MANQQHIEWLFEGVDKWNARREKENFQPDLSDTNVRGEFEDAGRLNHNKEIPLADINLSNAILINCNLTLADLTNANFTNADLANACLSEARLFGARFVDAGLNDTDLIETDISNANFGGVELWRAFLYPESGPVHDRQQQTYISSISDLLSAIDGMKGQHDFPYLYYFRGEVKDCWELRPSLMRDDTPSDLMSHESDMLRELTSRRPEEFSNTNSALDQWVLAQHHGLKTRFLDIMKNPLVGLYFASENKGGDADLHDGRLHVFVAPQSLVKPYNSDTVSIVANFARLSKRDQDSLLGKTKAFVSSPYRDAMDRLCQLVQAEKPYFAERINPKDFYRVLIIEPQRSIERLRAQTGALLVSAYHNLFEKNAILQVNQFIPVYTHYKFTIPSKNKEGIRTELGLLNITRETLFPGLETAAEAVMHAYGGGVSK